jgi:hypothetical protein
MNAVLAAIEHRVVFDFEVEFDNGGGLQGQDFRLDIDGRDIDDAALAEYLVRDLRLLAVARVRILRKAVVAEAHRRPEGLVRERRA